MPAGNHIQLESELAGASGALVAADIPTVPATRAFMMLRVVSFSGTCTVTAIISGINLQGNYIILDSISLAATGAVLGAIVTLPAGWRYNRTVAGTTVDAVYQVDLILIPPEDTPI